MTRSEVSRSLRSVTLRTHLRSFLGRPDQRPRQNQSQGTTSQSSCGDGGSNDEESSWRYGISSSVRSRFKFRLNPCCIQTDSRHPPGQLHVVNGLPSSIYSTATTSLNPVTLLITHGNDPSAHGSYISPMLVGASTPNLIANFPSGFFNPSEREASPAVASPPVSPPVGPFATPFAVSPAQLHGHNSNVIHAQPTLASFDKGPISSKKTAPLTIKKKSVPTLATISPIELAEINRETSIVDKPAGRPALLPRQSSRLPPTPASNPTTSDLPFRVIKPSLETLEKTMSIALFFEQYYHALLRAPPIHAQSTPHAGNYLLNRARRLAQLEATFALPENRFMSEAEKESMREELNKEENTMLRERRRKVDAKAFKMGRVIGHGAFGVVRIARERETGRLVAIKQLRKSE